MLSDRNCRRNFRFYKILFIEFEYLAREKIKKYYVELSEGLKEIGIHSRHD